MNKQSVNDKKVTDHHALLVTEVFARELNKDERNIYDMIVCRMLEAFSPKCTKELTTIKLSSNNIDFEARGVVIKKLGWRAV